jgi:hypothetical protein
MKKAIRFTIMALLTFAILTGVFIWPLPGITALATLLTLIGFYDLFQKKHTILRNFPLIGHIPMANPLIEIIAITYTNEPKNRAKHTPLVQSSI